MTDKTSAAAAGVSSNSGHVIVDPYYISFPPPHAGRCIQTSLMVVNPSDKPHVYKLATARPELFVVRPHIGLIAPRSGVRVYITLRDISNATPAVTPDTTVLFRVMAKQVTHNAELLAPPSNASSHSSTLRLARQVWAHEAQTNRTAVDVVAYFSATMPPLPSTMVTFLPANYAAPIPASRGTRNEARRDVKRKDTIATNSGGNVNSEGQSVSAASQDNGSTVPGASTGLVEDPVDDEDEELELPLDDAEPPSTLHTAATSNEERDTAETVTEASELKTVPRKRSSRLVWLLLMSYAVLAALVMMWYYLRKGAVANVSHAGLTNETG